MTGKEHSGENVNGNLAFCGRRGSGKTQLSNGVAMALGARWTGFGPTIKRIAVERGMPVTRANLQSLGADLVSNDPVALCRRVIDEASISGDQRLVIDGLRHRSIYDALSVLSKPRRLWCIYVDVADAVRFARLMARDGVDLDAIKTLDTHSTEIQVPVTLHRLADYIADNNGELGDTLRGVLRWLQTVEIGASPS